METQEHSLECKHCYYKSTLSEMFIQTYPDYFSKKIKVCPGCYQKLNIKLAKQGNYLFLGVSSFVFAISFLKPHFQLPFLLINLFLFFLSVKVGLLLHEFGHATIAKALGGYVPKVIIGGGALRFKLTLGHTQWEFRHRWSHGLTYIGFSNKSYIALKYAVSILAGPLANLFAVVFTFVLVAKSDLFANLTHNINLPFTFMVANLILFLSSIYPRTIVWLGAVETDGKQLLEYFFSHQAFISRYRRQYYLVLLTQLFEQQKFEEGLLTCRKALLDNPGEPMIKNFLGVFLINSKKFIQAINLLEEELIRKELHEDTLESKMLLAITKNNLAYALLESCSDNFEVMLGYSKSAYETLPWVPSVLQTYALLMIKTDKFNQAIQDLLTAITFEQSDISLSDSYVLLGDAYFNNNEINKAQEYLAKAKAIMVENPKILELEIQLNDAAAN